MTLTYLREESVNRRRLQWQSEEREGTKNRACQSLTVSKKELLSPEDSRHLWLVLSSVGEEYISSTLS